MARGGTADGLEDEVRTDVAAAGQFPGRLAPAEILNPPHEVTAFDVRIERDGRPQGQRGLTAVPDRIDGDNLGRALDPRPLNRRMKTANSSRPARSYCRDPWETSVRST